MNPSPESRALANILANTFGGNGLTTQQQVELAAQQIEEHVNERIHDYDLRQELKHDADWSGSGRPI